METIFLDHINESARLLEGSSLKCLSTTFVSDPERECLFLLRKNIEGAVVLVQASTTFY